MLEISSLPARRVVCSNVLRVWVVAGSTRELLPTCSLRPNILSSVHRPHRGREPPPTVDGRRTGWVVSWSHPNLSDRVVVYPADGSGRCQLFQSWKRDIVPRLKRQRLGEEPRSVKVRIRGKGETIQVPERVVRVIVWNGTNHYDGTVDEPNWPLA